MVKALRWLQKWSFQSLESKSTWSTHLPPSWQVTRPLGHLQQTAPVFQEKSMVIMVLTSKNYFYLLNLTFAGVVFPTSMVSRFLAEDLAWATTTFLCPLPCVTTGVFTQGFTCTTALTFQHDAKLAASPATCWNSRTGNMPEKSAVFSVQWSCWGGRGTS